MHVLFFLSDPRWTARARIFATAAHGLVARGHEVSIACPPGPIIDRIDSKAIGVVRLDPAANAALGTFDFRRVAQERSLQVVFVHTVREQLVVGSGLRLASGGGGRVFRRVGAFETFDDEPGLITSRVAPARTIVSTNGEAAIIINSGLPQPFVVPLGIDWQELDSTPPASRRDLHRRDDDFIIACPYSLDARPRLLNVLRTLALLAPRHPRLRAIVFGERATDDDLRMQAAALGVAPLVQFLDGARVEPVALAKASELVWIAADHDAAALGCLDAMCAARAIIAERSPTTEYYVADGINGTLLPEGESSVIAAAVASAIARADARAAQGAAGRHRLQREHGVAAMIDGFDRVIQSTRQVATAQ